MSIMLFMLALTVVEEPQGATVRIDHRGTALDVAYRPQVEIRHRQVGSVTPGGVAPTMRCIWKAEVRVDRQPTAADGRTLLARTIPAGEPIEGSRAGSCVQNRGAIAAEVAARQDVVDRRLADVIAADRTVLLAEMDDAHAVLGGAK